MEPSTPKILFITHDAGYYGASRSLQLLLRRFGPGEADLIVARRPFRGSPTEREVREAFGPAVGRVAFFFLPLDYCYRGQPGPRPVRWIYEMLLRVLWTFDRGRFQRMLRDGGYACVHLNSLILHRIVAPGRPWVIHVREILDRMTPRVSRSLEAAAGVIFVDETTAEPFRGLRLRKPTVLQNPINMLPDDNATRSSLVLPFEPSRTTVFSMVGKITEDKGVPFVISSFRQVANPNTRLLIVGGGEDRAAITACRDAAGDDTRIVFWGEEREIERVFAVTDYVLRGEPYFCVGRSTYEGLYAGCAAIMPGTADNGPALPEYGLFRDKVHFYAPRDGAALTDLLRACSERKMTDRKRRSNADDYARSFRSFIAAL